MSISVYHLHARTAVAVALVIGSMLPTCVLAQQYTDATGGLSPSHNNRQPYLGVTHIVRLQGVFGDLGEIGIFAGNFAPVGWALADGQLLPIASNTSLFSKLGTTYGGDGQTTFALPDLRGRATIGAGSGPGLSTRAMGNSLGGADTLLTINQMPSHNHTAEDPVITDFIGGGQSHNNMQPSLALRPMIATVGVYPSSSILTSESAIPRFAPSGIDPYVGEIVHYAASNPVPPSGWEFAEGQLLNIGDHTALFSLLGTTYGGNGETTFGLPDLRGRTAIHAGNGPGLSSRSLGQKLGVENVTLGLNNLPNHVHTGVPTTSGETDAIGGNLPHENMQPSQAINYIVALQGVFPSPSAEPAAGKAEQPLPLLGSGGEPYIGSISMFGGNFAPSGWALANGQLLSIASNQALYSVLGTTYGGDGEVSFALPDLRGRTPIHVGTGHGLSPISWGQKSGQETVFLTTPQMPSHTHAFADEPTPGDANGDGHVDGTDYLVWANNFGDDPADDPPGAPENGDYNDDGVVNGLDYLLWAANFGQGPFEAVAIPEPSACALLFTGAVMLLTRRRKRGE